MNPIRLSKSERSSLERQLRNAHNARLYRRTLAVLEYDEGRAIAEIARMLRVHRRSVHRWVEWYRESRDASSLRDEPRSGRPSKWTDECSEWLHSFLQRYPIELGYFAANWTVPLLRDALTVGMGRWLSDISIRRAMTQLGYEWKRPRYVLLPDPDLEKKAKNSAGNTPFASTHCFVG